MVVHVLLRVYIFVYYAMLSNFEMRWPDQLPRIHLDPFQIFFSPHLRSAHMCGWKRYT
jgi:hypothetical protein